MAGVIAVLGAGPHGHQIASLVPHSDLYDDHLAGYDTCLDGARRHPWIVGAAWPTVRRTIAETIERTDQHYVCEPHHGGIVVFPGAKIGAGVELGQHVHVEYNAVVSHGCVIGDYATICPGAVLAGEVTLEPEVFIGANATVIHGGLTIGQGAIVGAGAVVVDNIPAGATVAGVPARVL